jgi:hypothetical protein
VLYSGIFIEQKPKGAVMVECLLEEHAIAAAFEG